MTRLDLSIENDLQRAAFRQGAADDDDAGLTVAHARRALDAMRELRKREDMACHVIIESGYNPGENADIDCRCEACRTMAQRMDEAGFMESVKDRWWTRD